MTVNYEYGGSLFKSRADWLAAMVSDWLTAGGTNGPWQIRQWFSDQRDAELTDELEEDGWLELPEADDQSRQPEPPTWHEACEAIAALRAKYTMENDDAA